MTKLIASLVFVFIAFQSFAQPTYKVDANGIPRVIKKNQELVASTNHQHYAAASYSTPPPPPSIFNKSPKEILVPASTMVLLKTIRVIEADKATIGQSVKFIAEMNVVVDGHVVISSNAIAVGKISEVIEATPTRSDAISIEVNSVQAVDGTLIHLNGAEEVITSRLKGESIGIQAGKTLIGYVMNNTTVVPLK